MNNLDVVALQAVLNRVVSAKDYYDRSNTKNISEHDADTCWDEAESNIKEAIALLRLSINLDQS